MAIGIAACAACRPSGGELSIDQLSRVVAREQDSLETCYQSALDHSPYAQEFHIQAILRIRPSGQVADVALDQNGISGLGPCVKKTIGSWKFPTAKAETRASLPLIFRPKVVKSMPQNVKLPAGIQLLQGSQ